MLSSLLRCGISARPLAKPLYSGGANTPSPLGQVGDLAQEFLAYLAADKLAAQQRTQRFEQESMRYTLRTGCLKE